MLELLHLIDKAFTLITDEICSRHANIVEEELRGIAASNAELIQLLADTESRKIGGHHKEPEGMISGLIIRPCEEREKISLRPVGDISLRTVDDIGIAIAFRPRSECCNIRPGARLGDRNCRNHITAYRRLEISLFEILTAKFGNRGSGHVRLNPDGDRWSESLNVRYLLEEYQLEPVIEPLTAVFRIVPNAEQPEIAHLFKQIVQRDQPRFLPLIDVGIDLIIHKLLYQFPQCIMIIVKIHQSSCPLVVSSARTTANRTGCPVTPHDETVRSHTAQQNVTQQREHPLRLQCSADNLEHDLRGARIDGIHPRVHIALGNLILR